MRTPSTHSPEYWRQLYPKDWNDILPCLRQANIDIVPMTFQEPSKHSTPIHVNTLRNLIIYHAAHNRDIPYNWEVYLYLDNNGDLKGLYTSPNDILSLAQNMHLKIYLANGRPLIPDKIAETNINAGIMETAIEQLVRTHSFQPKANPSQITDPVHWVQYEKYGGYVPGWILQTTLQKNTQAITSCKNIKYIPILPFKISSDEKDEDCIFARYAALMLRETLGRGIDKKTFPAEWKTLCKLLYPQINAKFTIDGKSDIWRILTRIEKPEISREPENESKNSFDFIEVRLGMLSTDAMKNRNQLVKDNIKDMIRLAYNIIQNSSAFERYDVPISILKPTRYVITQQSELVITFELKSTTK